MEPSERPPPRRRHCCVNGVGRGGLLPVYLKRQDVTTSRTCRLTAASTEYEARTAATPRQTPQLARPLLPDSRQKFVFQQ